MDVPTFRPLCPNHGAPLEGLPFPLPEKGKGMCPVSGFSFEFRAEVDKDKMVQDKYGNLTKEVSWRLKGKD